MKKHLQLMREHHLCSILLCSFGVLLSAVLPAAGATMNIGVAEDAYVHSGNPNTNYGNSTLYVGDENWNNPAICCRSYLKFNLGSIPAGSTIISKDMAVHLGHR